MNNKIDNLLTKLSAAPLDHSLAGLERDIECALREKSTGVLALSIFEPLQLVTLGVALIIGVTIGTTNSSPKMAVSPLFAAETGLAVSTILEGG